VIKFKPLASGSKGNCYHLTDGTTEILLECGIPIRKIREGLDFRLSSVAACLVSHEHQDHAKAIADMMAAGIDVYASRGTIDALGLRGHRLHPIQALQGFEIDSWYILPFDLVHDAAEPLGFVCVSGDERLLFATDTAYIKYVMPGLTHICIECNYDEETLSKNVIQGKIDPVLRQRVIENHMSLDRVKAMLSANDLSRVEEIWLLHLSDGNADAERFHKEIFWLTGRRVHVA
jgi:phosphoribosyl 1,2-cyclic phosphodiesterase